MENRLSYILVGIFIFVLVIAGVLATLWLGHYSSEGVFKFYKVATKESVSGLNNKAPVKLKGVEIGEVRGISINPQNAEEVLVIIRVQDNAPIKEDTYALIEAQGITGLSYIELRGGSNESNALKTSTKIEEYGIIPSKPSTFSRLDKTLSSVSAKAEEIFDRANQILSEKNLKNFETIMENSAKISESTSQTLANIEAQKKQINMILQNALKFEKSAIEASESIKTMSSSFTNAIDNTGIDTMVKMREAAQNISSVMLKLDAKVQKGTFDMDVLVKENLLPAQGALDELRILANETKELINNLKDSPSDLLFKAETINPAPNEK
ncbi:MAG: MlaD family protein [Sulfurospirillaceae bacterium]|nr:MlaD family protein [Sulfurospirillaceae bacterium]MDD2825408.1 MlaD family protein [Sulfurospirillaceae bacterium]